MNKVRVVGAVIVENGKILCAQRGPDKVLPALWEFPGGKIESDETPEQALIREIREEMLCQIEIGDQVERTVHEYDFATIDLTTFYCKVIEGKATLTEHVRIEWLSPGELGTLEWTPADIPTIQKLASGETIDQ